MKRFIVYSSYDRYAKRTSLHIFKLPGNRHIECEQDFIKVYESRNTIGHSYRYGYTIYGKYVTETVYRRDARRLIQKIKPIVDVMHT